MKHAIIFLNLLFMGFGVARAQVTLTATSGTGSGTFTTLKEAFDAINAGTHQGTIVININESTSESASAVLNASGTGSASYSSVAITPSGARTITGAITGHLIDLDGADNVTIDGLNSGGNSLSIINTATGASSTVRFINDASNNTVQNATIQGSTTSFGVVFFSTGTTTGNDGNNINNCTITAAGANFPINGIYSLGTSALIDNSGNTINANSISDFFSAGSATFGINVNSFNSTWTVSNNKLFQTSTRTYTTDNTHNAIAVSHGDGYAITGNTIGYASAAGTGVYTMTIPEGVTVPVRPRFIGINLAVGTTTASSVQGNTITAINLSTASAENSANGILCGINITAGNVNVGNLTANTIGASSGVDALSATKTTPSGAVVGINSSSTGIIVIQNNEIGGLTSTGITATASGNIIGINVTGVATSINISTNIIGNATANNMRGGTLGITTNGSGAAGINLASTPTSATINNNTIRNLSSYGTAVGGYVRGIMTTTTTSETATGWTINNNTISNLTTNNTSQFATNGVISAVGIHHASSLGCTISQNTISNISNINSTSTFNIIVAGISLGASARITTLVTSITGNKIFGLSNLGVATSASRPPTLAGILVSAGNNINLIANNLISLGNGQSTNTTIIGIWSHNSSTNPSSTNVYHNSVNIEGTVTSGAHSSFGFQRGDLSTTATVSSRTVVVDLRNNIFNNTRSGGTGGHYAISNNFGATAVSATGWGVNASNFNVLNAASGTIGYWSSAQTFSGWKTASASDNNSISAVSVPFTNTATGDLHLNYGTTPTQLESGGTTLAAITTDFDNDARPGPTGTVNGGALFSDIGADEFDGVMVFNSLTWNGSVSNDWSNASNWTPAILPDNRSTGIIPTGLSNYPVLTTNVSMNELTLSSSSTLNLSSNNLTLSGNLINNGSITGTGILELNGAKAQQISGTGTVNNIKINNTSGGVSIASGSNKLNVTGLYTPTNGVLTTNGNLVFRSTATQEGVVGTAGICPTEPISGDVTVEKYIPAKRAFRFLTPGVTTSTTINANWQEGSSVNSTVGYPYVGGTTENPTSGYGTHIMGTGGATNGFDLSISNSPSLFTFNVSSYAWVAEANTNVAGNVLNRGEAYRLFVRGDRGVNLNTDAEAATATTI
ncbi:MAG: hypothetical protein RLZZ172_1932, partial [Bacteroidota bacterium]